MIIENKQIEYKINQDTKLKDLIHQDTQSIYINNRIINPNNKALLYKNELVYIRNKSKGGSI